MSLTKYAEFEVIEARPAINGSSPRLKTSHRVAFDYQPRAGYIYVRSRAISSRCNDNFDEFPAEEIKQAYRTFVGKPVFVNHHNADHRRARGVIIDAALHEDTNPDGTPDTWAEVLMEVDAVRFPVLAKEVLAGNIARTSMGTDVKYSVCTACGNKAETPLDYCQHIPRMKGMKIRRVNAATGANEDVLIAERCYGLGFFENSLLVEDPADPTAFVLGVESGMDKAAARQVIDEAEGLVRHAWDTTQEQQHPRHSDGEFRSKDSGSDAANAPQIAPQRSQGPRPADAPASAPSSAPASAWQRSKHKGTQHDPIPTADVADAASAIAAGKWVDLTRPREVSTLVDKLGQMMAEAKKAGRAQTINLCQVTVKGTNLFCVENVGIPRIKMPQLGVTTSDVAPDAPAMKYVIPGTNYIDLGPAFRKSLTDRGVKISDSTLSPEVMKASQNELNAGKVAGLSHDLDTLSPEQLKAKGWGEALFVSRDDYIVDGHHRWAGQVTNDYEHGRTTTKMPVQVIDMPITELLKEANAFAAANGVGGNDVSKTSSRSGLDYCCGPEAEWTPLTKAASAVQRLTHKIAGWEPSYGGEPEDETYDGGLVGEGKVQVMIGPGDQVMGYLWWAMRYVDGDVHAESDGQETSIEAAKVRVEEFVNGGQRPLFAAKQATPGTPEGEGYCEALVNHGQTNCPCNGFELADRTDDGWRLCTCGHTWSIHVGGAVVVGSKQAASEDHRKRLGIPEDHVFVRFNSHRSLDKFQRHVAQDGERAIPLVSFTKEEIHAIPAAARDRLQQAGGNTAKGVQFFKRTPDLSEYRRPMFEKDAVNDLHDMKTLDGPTREGYRWAMSTLASEPLETRQAIARDMDAQKAKLPFDSAQAKTFSGALMALADMIEKTTLAALGGRDYSQVSDEQLASDILDLQRALGANSYRHPASTQGLIQAVNDMKAEQAKRKGKTSTRHEAYGETKAPAKVDTMRAENCPVCGDDESFNGEKCNVCGYIQPPSQFRDPDLGKAKQMDLRQDQAEDQGLDPEDGVGAEGPLDAAQDPNADTGEDLQCTNCGEVFSAGTQEEAPEAEDPAASDLAQPEDPQGAPGADPHDQHNPHDLSDLADKSDDELGLDDNQADDQADDEVDPTDPTKVKKKKKANPFVKATRTAAFPPPKKKKRPEDQDPNQDPNQDPDQDQDATDPATDELTTGEGEVTPGDQPEADASPQAPVGDPVGELDIAPNMTCPVCGQGTLIPLAQQPAEDQEPPLNEVGTTPAKITSRRSTVDMNQPNPAQQRRNRIIAAIQEQQGLIESQASTIDSLVQSVATLAVAAGVGNHPKFAGIVRQAGLRQAADTNAHPEGAPSTTTQDAKKPDATDDVNSVGTAPGKVNSDVTPKGTTDVQNSDVVANPPVLDNLQNVTQPVGGTDAPTPAAGDAAGTSTVTVGTPSNDSFDSKGPSWKSSAKEEQERFVASLRLARLRIAVLNERGEDLALGQAIAASEQTTEAIQAQAATLSQVEATRKQAQPTDEQRRRLVPVSRTAGALPVGSAPSMQSTAVVARDGEDEWMVGGLDD